MSDPKKLVEDYTNTFKIIHRLARHMEETRQTNTDDLTDEKLFRGRKNIIVTKMELVIDENFGDDVCAFRKRLEEQAAKALIENKGSEDLEDLDLLVLLEIETWLDAELAESAKLYPQE